MTPQKNQRRGASNQIAAGQGSSEQTEPKSSDDADTEISETTIRPEFKEAVDSYEDFFDEYVAFMEKYSESDDTASMLADYSSYMTQYAETMEKMESIDEDDSRQPRRPTTPRSPPAFWKSSPRFPSEMSLPYKRHRDKRETARSHSVPFP